MNVVTSVAVQRYPGIIGCLRSAVLFLPVICLFCNCKFVPLHPQTYEGYNKPEEQSLSLAERSVTAEVQVGRVLGHGQHHCLPL